MVRNKKEILSKIEDIKWNLAGQGQKTHYAIDLKGQKAALEWALTKRVRDDREALLPLLVGLGVLTIILLIVAVMDIIGLMGAYL